MTDTATTPETSYVTRFTNEAQLDSYLREHLNANDIEPHVAGLDAWGLPFIAWLVEADGALHMSVSRLAYDDEDSSHVQYMQIVEETTKQGGYTSLCYPIVVMNHEVATPPGPTSN